MTITAATRQYWLDTVLGWAEDRLMPPQFEECKAALTAPEAELLATAAKIADGYALAHADAEPLCHLARNIAEDIRGLARLQAR